ncbi:MAG: 2-iminobutanoate/2-iminopropanoate deaminase, partial [Polaribacter sp.]
MKKIITTTKAPAPIGPYNQATLSGNTLYTSGQIAINPANGELVLDNISTETKQVMEN